MLTLDGSTLEGGGQLTRMAICLSALTRVPIKIHSIRAGRGHGSNRRPHGNRDEKAGRHKNAQHTKRGQATGQSNTDSIVGGGLKESHLAALRWLAGHCYANVDGDTVGSREVVFKPGKQPWTQEPVHLPIKDTIELSKPGSVWLIFQAIFPFMVFGAHSKAGAMDSQDEPTPLYHLTLVGGTNVPKSMATEYIQQVFLPICEKVGLPQTKIETVKRGWTTGKIEIGKVRVKVYPPRDLDGTAAEASDQPERNLPESISNTTQPSTPPFILPSFQTTTRGTITSISITLLTSSPTIHHKLLDLITSSLRAHPVFSSLASSQPSISIHPSSSTETGDSRRLYILLVAHTSNGWVLGRDYLGPGSLARNTRQEDVMLQKASTSVVQDLMGEVAGGGCVDEFMADQLVVFQALAKGCSVVDAGSRTGRDVNRDVVEDEDQGDQVGSLHTRTVRWVCEEILERYGVKFDAGGRCEGVAWNDRDCKVKDNGFGLDEMDSAEGEQDV